MKKVVITGAHGFIGRALVQRLAQDRRHELIAFVRALSPVTNSRIQEVAVGDLAHPDYGPDVLNGVDVVVHAAARVHVMRDNAADPLSEFRRTNVNGTLALARQAASAGVRRFVFISSLKVNGETSRPGKPIRFDDPMAPADPYAVSKREAEDGLQEIARRSALEIVIVRPPMVYGPAAGGNFAALAKLVRAGVPLPFAALTGNRRSFVALENLADLIVRCVEDASAAGQTFLVSDGEDLSTADLLRRMAKAMHRQSRMLAIPPAVLRGAAALLHRSAAAQRLLGSLQVDISHTCSRLAWVPPVTVDIGLSMALRPHTKGVR